MARAPERCRSGEEAARGGSLAHQRATMTTGLLSTWRCCTAGLMSPSAFTNSAPTSTRRCASEVDVRRRARAVVAVVVLGGVMVECRCPMPRSRNSAMADGGYGGPRRSYGGLLGLTLFFFSFCRPFHSAQVDAAATLLNLSISCCHSLFSTNGYHCSSSSPAAVQPFTAAEDYRPIVGSKGPSRTRSRCSSAVTTGLALYPLNRGSMVELSAVTGFDGEAIFEFLIMLSLLS